METFHTISCSDQDFLMEETCDSDSVFESSVTTSSGSYCAARFSEFDRFLVADDAQSTTSDTNYMEDSYQEEFEEPIAKSYVEYLQEASDDELGLPPSVTWFGDDMLLLHPMELDFDVENSERKVAQRDDSLFWLSLLRS